MQYKLFDEMAWMAIDGWKREVPPSSLDLSNKLNIAVQHIRQLLVSHKMYKMFFPFWIP